MPQELFPMFSPDEVMITEFLSYETQNGSIYYFQYGLPIFNHPENDKASFRMFTSQLIVNGNCKQVDIIKAFGVSAISVKRWVKLYRQDGVKGFCLSCHLGYSHRRPTHCSGLPNNCWSHHTKITQAFCSRSVV